MHKTIFTWSLIALAMLVFSGCDSQAPIVDSHTDAPTITASEETDGELITETATVTATVTITEVAFGADSSTFLDTIATAMGAQETPISHRFVEFDDRAGQRWQGEALIDGDNQRVFLQPMQSGGAEGVLIETAANADIGAIVADFEHDDAPTEYDPAVFPEIRFVRARATDDGVWAFDVTLAYPDTGWEDYADGWHVETLDGEVLGTRILLHPHVNEQPFTRSLGSVSIPAEITTILIRSHALINGYGPEPLVIPLDESTEADLFEVIKHE